MPNKTLQIDRSTKSKKHKKLKIASHDPLLIKVQTNDLVSKVPTIALKKAALTQAERKTINRSFIAYRAIYNQESRDVELMLSGLSKYTK